MRHRPTNKVADAEMKAELKAMSTVDLIARHAELQAVIKRAADVSENLRGTIVRDIRMASQA